MIDRSQGEPLQNVTEAMILSERIADLGDHVVDHFVGKAREAGASWAEIGQSLGVSKQAAQKRFARSKDVAGQRFQMRKGGLFTRFDETGRFVVQTAVRQAHGLPSMEITTLHLVTGLCDPESGQAARAISALAGAAEQVADAARDALTGPPKRPRKVKHLPFTEDCKKVLELSLREAIRAENRSIGSEHILLGLLREVGSEGARLLVDHGVTRGGVETWLEENPVNDQ